MNETAPKKSFFSKKIRIVALILAILLLGELIFSSSVAVNFSSEKYADSEYERPAEYIEQNDSYINASTLRRMRAAVQLLGEPKDYEQFSLFASVAIADEEYAKAADYLLSAAELYTGDDTGLSAVYVKIGCLRALDKDWAAAAPMFRKAIELDGESLDARLMLCETYLNLGDYEKALAALEEYSSLAELSSQELDALIQLQIDRGKYDDALSSCNAGETDGRLQAADAAFYRAEVYYLTGETEKALEQAELSRTLGGDAVKTASIIAFCSEELGDFQKALDACLKLIDAGLGDLALYQQAAQDAYMLSDFDSTRRLSEEALEKFGDSPEALPFHKWLGLCYFETNELGKAKTHLAAVVNSGESLPELNYLLGICRMADGEYDGAVSDFTASLASEELYDEALYNRALCLISLGKTDAASADFQEIIDRDSSEEIIGRICDLLGVSPDRLERSGDAEK